jgi:hypothetical protein
VGFKSTLIYFQSFSHGSLTDIDNCPLIEPVNQGAAEGGKPIKTISFNWQPSTAQFFQRSPPPAVWLDTALSGSANHASSDRPIQVSRHTTNNNTRQTLQLKV